MPTPAKTFDVAAFETAFQAALPKAHKIMSDKVANAQAKGLPVEASMASLASVNVGNLQTTFCASWPKIETFLNFAITALGWFMPGPAAMAKAFISTVKTSLLPIVCPTVPPAE